MIRRHLAAAAVTIALFLFCLPTAFALYVWTDEKGTIHITDYPKPGSRPAEQEPEAPSSAPVQKAAPPEAAKAGASRTADQPMKQEARPQPSPPVATPAAQAAKTVMPAGTTPIPIQQPKPATASSATKTAQPAPAMNIPIKQATSLPSQPPMMQAPPQAMSPAGPPANAPLAALVAGFLSAFLVVFAGVYIFFSLCLYLIAKKLDVSTAWTAWIPIIQISAFLGSAGKPLWWFLLFFIPVVNFGVSIYLWMCIAENLGKNKMLGVLMIIPFVNFIIMAVLAFSKKEGSFSASTA